MAGTRYEYILTLTDKMSSALRKAGYMGSQTYKKLQADQEKLNRTAQGFGNTLGKLGIAFGAFEIGKRIFNAGADIEQTRVSFEVLLGSLEKGNALMKEIKTYGAASPYESKGLQENAKMMLGFGLAGDKVMPTMKMLGDVAMGNQEKLNSLTLAYSQVSSAGKMQGQDLLQMINAGFNPLAIMADKLSKKLGIDQPKAMQILRKEMEKGKISAQMVEQTFIEATSEGGRFYQMAAKQSLTLNGRFSTLKDNINMMFEKFGEKANGSFLKIVNRLIQLTDWIMKNSDFLLKWGKVLLWIVGIWKAIRLTMTISSAVTRFYNKTVRKTNASLFVLSKRLGGAGAASGTYSGLMGIATLTTKVFTQSVKALSKAIYQIPIIGWILAGITLLVAAFDWLWENSEKFRGVLYGIWEVVKMTFEWLNTAVSWLWNKVLIPLFAFTDKIVSAVFGALGDAWDWLLENVFKPIGDFLDWFGIGLDKIWKNIKEGLYKAIEPFIKLWNVVFSDNKIVIDIKERFNKGYDKGVNAFRADKNKKKPGTSGFMEMFGGLMEMFGGAPGGMPTMPGGTTDGLDGIGATGKGIAEGGNRPTNVNITLGNLVQTLTVTPVNMAEGAKEIEKLVREALLRVLNSANGVAYGN